MRLSRFVDHVIKQYIQTRGRYFLFILLGIVSCVGVWWSLNHRISLVDALTADTLRYLKLAEDVERLRALDLDTELVLLRQRVHDANGLVLPGYTALADFLNTQSAAAMSAGLEMSYRFLPEYDVEGLESVRAAPLVFSLVVPGKDKHNGFGKLLAFGRHLHEQPWRQSLTSMEVVGQGGGAQKMRIETALWVRVDDTLTTGSSALVAAASPLSEAGL
ncbi:MAG TPA: hypothetical protein DD979_09515 [Gammaproteobacteria bacterium]|nr:hypothetical protein [Gammaproteobacteria bacterium]